MDILNTNVSVIKVEPTVWVISLAVIVLLSLMTFLISRWGIIDDSWSFPAFIVIIVIGVLTSMLMFMYHDYEDINPLTKEDYDSKAIIEISSLVIEEEGEDFYSFSANIDGLMIEGEVPREYLKVDLNGSEFKKKYLGVKLSRKTFVGTEYDYYIIEK